MMSVRELEPDTTSYICEDFIQGVCQHGDHCNKLHYPAPYLWQMNLDSFGVYSFSPEISLFIESQFCHPMNTECHLEQSLAINESCVLTDVCINFDIMMASVRHLSSVGKVDVKRLSTMSYAMPLLSGSKDSAVVKKYYTQWRWYWYHADERIWKVFGEHCPIPDQQTLEMKFCFQQRQLDYRFEASDGIDFVIEYGPSNWLMTLLPFVLLKPTNKTAEGWPIRRRPLLQHSSALSPQWPPIKQLPYVISFPMSWTPLDQSKDWEVVKLSKDSAEFAEVNGSFVKSLMDQRTTTHRKVKEIFRLQNPFVWQRYVIKKNFMQANNNCNEKQLFHGTMTECAVKGICRHGFDIRCNGVNNTIYGRGSYFAASSGYSDRYAHNSVRRRSWMFLARVLVGRYALGNKTMSRPPPIDPARPFAELYDSCVDSTSNPKLFVIFDCDQCYPEYIIGYNDASTPDSD